MHLLHVLVVETDHILHSHTVHLERVATSSELLACIMSTLKSLSAAKVLLVGVLVVHAERLKVLVEHRFWCLVTLALILHHDVVGGCLTTHHAIVVVAHIVHV